jgi:hypothetical protein
MSLTASVDAPDLRRVDRLEVLFEELGELMGQRNAIDARIVEIIAETGSCTATANTIAAIAHRLPEFPLCAQGMHDGRLSLDQVGAIAKRPAPDPMPTTPRWPRSPPSANSTPH